MKTCTQVFTAALFIVAKRWTQSKCAPVDGWINHVVCPYNGISFSHKKECNTDKCYKVDES